MFKKITLPDQISSRTEYKRKFSAGEMYHAFMRIPQAAGKMLVNRKKKLIARDFVERIQLAVTEVNGCAACSYAHSYMALNQGMSNEEINSILSGDGAFLKESEVKGIAFAQHCAESRGFPKADAFEAIISEYGEEKTWIILSAAQLMFAGNIYGIPYSAMMSRLNGKPFKDSSLTYELGMQIAGFLFLPFALIDGFLRAVMGYPNIKFDQSSTP